MEADETKKNHCFAYLKRLAKKNIKDIKARNLEEPSEEPSFRIAYSITSSKKENT